MTPFDVVCIYCLVSPLVLLAIVIYLLREQPPQVNVKFPSIIACGKVDRAGKQIKWTVPLKSIKPNTRILLVEG